MANAPFINCRVTITARDLNNNNVAKTLTQVKAINFDYADGTINIVDATGSFYFPMKPVTSVVDTIVAGVNGQHSFVIS